jgi:DNA-binding transcriptional regulator YiaG
MPIIWTAKRIKNLRAITRHSQATFSEAAGVSRVTISNWESKFKAPSAKHQRSLDEIAEKAGVTQRQLDR